MYNVIESSPNDQIQPKLFVSINRIPVMVLLTAPLLGVYFYRGISPSKIGHIAPFLDRIQPLSSTRAFLPVKKKRRLLSMGRTSTANKPFAL
jgi:hypothetical protein